MYKLVISTVGTSLLTHQVNRNNPAEKDWEAKLRNTANEKEPPLELVEIVDELRRRASKKLADSEVSRRRGFSAELNGLYGLYENQLKHGQQDVHYLIATDTYQCQTTAEIIKDFLHGEGLSVDKYVPPGLSTATTEDFSGGIDELIAWLEQTVTGYKDKDYEVYFNLVGGFKSLQGYLNTIGMFYADKILYIFEGQNSELITIPRLPITLDYAALQPHQVPLALMATDLGVSIEYGKDVPESLITTVGEEVTLSTWGKLTWNKCKQKFLSDELLPFPKLQIADSFKRDYQGITRPDDKVKLQETLAKVVCLLIKNQGDTRTLKEHKGLQYDNYTQAGSTPIGHFRVTQDLRVSCVAEKGELYLRRYGREPDVNKNP